MMYYDPESFTDRMQYGRDRAAERRHKGMTTGAPLPDRLRTRTQEQAAFDAAYPDAESRAAWATAETERQAAENAAAWEAWQAMNAAELARFGTGIDADLPAWANPDVDHLPEESGEATPIASPCHHGSSEPSEGSARARRQREATTMTGDEYKAACKRLGMSVYRSAKVLGISLSTAQRYASGTMAVPRAVELALLLAAKHGETPDDMAALAPAKRRARK